MHVAELYIHPVKSCASIAVDRLDFDALGPRRDRRWMVVDLEPGTGAHSPGVLRALSTFHSIGDKACFGQNAVHRTLGSIRVGDPVAVDAGPDA